MPIRLLALPWECMVYYSAPKALMRGTVRKPGRPEADNKRKIQNEKASRARSDPYDPAVPLFSAMGNTEMRLSHNTHWTRAQAVSLRSRACGSLPRDPSRNQRAGVFGPVEPGAAGSTGVPAVPLEPGVVEDPLEEVVPEVVGEVSLVNAPLYWPPLWLPLAPDEEVPEPIDAAPELLPAGAVLIRPVPVVQAASTIAQARGIIHLVM